MLTAHFDDSGTDASGTFCVLAGYISTVEGWQAFSEEWQLELRAEPTISHLKMSQAASMRGPFAGWDRAARDEKVLRLTRTINRHAMFGVASLVSHAVYAKEAKGFLPGTVDNPYWLCFQRALLETLRFCVDQQRMDGKIDFVFDSQGVGYERRAGLMHANWANVLAAPHAALLGNITFANDRDTLPLQAADLLAWHVRRRGDRAIQDAPENRPLDEVLGELPIMMHGWTADEISDFVEGYQQTHPLSPINRPDLHRTTGKREG